MTSAIDPTTLRTIADGLDHPEGVALGPDGHLFAGGEAGQVYRIDPETAATEQIATTGGFALGIALDAHGAIYVCDAGRAAIVRVDPAGTVDDWCASAAGQALTTPNWGAFGPDGSYWFTDSGTEALDVHDGRLLRVGPGGGEADVLDLPALHFPNGLCLDGDEVCLLESFTPRLSRLTPRGLEMIATLDGVVPDGVAVDAEGGFVIGCYYPFRLLRVAPASRSVSVLMDDVTGIHAISPTNVAFYGAGLTELAIAQLGGRGLKGCRLPFAGAPLNYPS